jgi:urease accessory protein
MHLADSAFPIGASSHSFGLETLIAEGYLRAPEIERFLTALLWESGQLDARFVRLAHRWCMTADEGSGAAWWLALNRYVAAAKGARESRMASATLGRRFLQTVAQLEDDPLLQQRYQAALTAAVDMHYCAAFGLVARRLTLAEEETVLAYLQQNVMGLVSACLRLLPIGQGRASEILWRLKPVITSVAAASQEQLPRLSADAGPPEWPALLAALTTFTPLVDLGSMRHPTLPTRLFIS